MQGDFRIAGWLVQPQLHTIAGNGKTTRVEAKAMQVLVYLAEHPEQVVSKEKLIGAVWADTFVTDDVLTRCISELRKAFDDDAKNPKIIETISRGGYRLVAVVQGAEAEPIAARAPVRGWWVGLAVAAGLAVLAIALNIGGLRERLFRSAPHTEIRSLVVLPLENLSGDPEQEYFAEGMTEALTTELAQISALRVISRSSAMKYKGTRTPMAEIAKALDVDAVVEGSVQRSGEKVGITVQLIHAPSDRHLWARPYQREFRDILALQREVAQAIAAEIRVKLTPQEQTRLASARPVNPEAYELYLKGYYLMGQPRGTWWRGNDLKKAISYYQQAIEKDPSYPLAYVGLANAYIGLASNGWVSPTEAYAKVRAAALKALELDVSLADAHCALGGVLDEYDRDWLGAEREYRKAIELNPSLGKAHHWLALLLSLLGRHEEAIAEIKEAQRLDPLSLTTKVNGGLILRRAWRLDEAFTLCRNVLELEPDYAPAMGCLGGVYLRQRKYQEAIPLFEKAWKLTPERPAALTSLGTAYAVSGKRSEALRVLQELKVMSKTKYIPPVEVAVIYATLGEKDRAIALLEKAYKERAPNITLIKNDPWLAPLHSDPRFQDLLRRMNFPP